MPSVGPQLPPHLIKRKRLIDDDKDLKSPPQKVHAAQLPRTLGPTLPPPHNPDELEVDSESDDGYGPSLGPSKPATKASSPPERRAVGPTPPPSKNPDELEVDDSSDDGYGPSKPTPTTNAPPPARRVLGPAPPPAPLSELPSHPANANEDSSDSDDDYGPSLPPAPGSAAEASLFAQQRAEQELSSSTTAASKPQRDDWMLIPPSDSDWTGRVDPTKLKNRKFASGKGAKAPAEKSGISAIWTETPEQKRLRLADEVLGRAAPSTSSASSRPRGPESKEDIETARRIKEYNDRNRNKSLYEERIAAQERGEKEKVEEDDPSKRGFDREKDMALGGRLGHGQKREMLAKAADFGSRFQKGKYL
jgi:hypothetical protein